MTDNATPDAAAVLYGGTPSPAPPAPSDDTTRNDAPPAPNLAERRQALTARREQLAAEVNALADEERQATTPEPADPADVLFDDPAVVARNFEPSLSDSLNDLTALAPELGEKRAELLSNAAEIFSDARIAPESAATLHSLYVATLQNPPDEATTQQWASESTEWLKANYPNGYASALNRVRQWVHAREDVKLLLERSGLGDHPQVVRALIENSAQLRLAPRKRR